MYFYKESLYQIAKKEKKKIWTPFLPLNTLNILKSTELSVKKVKNILSIQNHFSNDPYLPVLKNIKNYIEKNFVLLICFLLPSTATLAATEKFFFLNINNSILIYYIIYL